MQLEPGSILTLDVEKAVAGGRMLARHDGRVVLVWAAIPGERVRARIERLARGIIYAEAVEVISPSPDRRTDHGDWRCGGNVYRHIAYSRQLELKGEVISDALARIGKIPRAASPAVWGSPEAGYRMRARFHIRDERIGFFREDSHELCEVGATAQLLAETTSWVQSVTRRLGPDGLRGISSIEIVENVPASERVCHLELKPGVNVNSLAVLSTDQGLTGLTASRVLGPGETPIARPIERLAGLPGVTDVLHVSDETPPRAVRLWHDVRAFFQGNRFLLVPLVRHVLNCVPPGPVVDLYAGVGLFGLSLAAAGGEEIVLVEGDPVSSADLLSNAEPFGARVQVSRTSVEAYVGNGSTQPETTFVVDPPRSGMSREGLAGVIAHRPRRVVFVSCDPATLARDVRGLLNAGYELDGLTGFDLFPNTAHIETVAVLTRA